MKKPILILVPILSLTACDPEKYMNTYSAAWYVKNTLDYPIKIFQGGYTEAIIVLPKDSFNIYRFNSSAYLGEPTFNLLYYNDYWERLDEKDQRLDILSEKGDRLKTWYYMEKHESGKQYFDETDWKLNKKEHYKANYDYYWVFEITHEDITPIEGE